MRWLLLLIVLIWLLFFIYYLIHVHISYVDFFFIYAFSLEFPEVNCALYYKRLQPFANNCNFKLIQLKNLHYTIYNARKPMHP